MKKVAKDASSKKKIVARKNEIRVWIKNKIHGREWVKCQDIRLERLVELTCYANLFEFLQVNRPSTFKQEDYMISFMYVLFCMKDE